MIIRNFEGLDLEHVGPHDSEDGKAEEDRMNTLPTPTTHYLQNAINTMTLLFPDDVRPTGADAEALNSRLEPIIEQIETLFSRPSQRSSILFSLLTGPTRKACKYLKLHDMELVNMLVEVWKRVLSTEKSMIVTSLPGALPYLTSSENKPTVRRKPLISAWNL